MNLIKCKFHSVHMVRVIPILQIISLATIGAKGATANAVGYSVGKIFAKIKTNKITSMPRAVRKNYVTDKIYQNSRSYGNANLHTFDDNSLETVELTFKVFKYGVYSTISSTLFSKAVFS